MDQTAQRVKGVRAVRAAYRTMAALLLGIALAAASPAQTQPSGAVPVLTITGVINPLTARYLERELARAAAEGAGAAVVRLNTPGGLESSTREMAQTLLGSPVPVIVYVAPAGARAASAGMFITIAAHVAAMAPGANIGAAHPVGVGGETDPVMAEKLVNDAAALARAIAVARGRNAAWAEEAVRASASLTAEEALAQRVIDLVASDLDELLRQIDGREVVTAAGTVTLAVAQAPRLERPMGLPERLLQTIIDPNIAFILFTIGVAGIIAELYNPGTLIPGVIGVIALVLAFTAFGSLPINWAGPLLLVLAAALFLVELNTEGIGFAAVGGVIAFLLGALFLYTPLTPTSPAMPDVRVSPWLVAAMTAGIATFFLLVLRAVFRARAAPVTVGPQALTGQRGVALSDLTPRGTVRVGYEHWTAVTEDADEHIAAGEPVEVVGVEGVTLRVKRAA